ncbi:MAG: hypothetical protein PHV88_06265 [Eubacteriales bacterium]|nr:hypothetical protein [Eubacteriales bacterium]MDD4327956.1 hypothetical protein [Eubacteriales bacterium]
MFFGMQIISGSVFEAAMLICFGAAWPISVYKSWKSRKTGGKSVIFSFVIFVGYLSGITSKLLRDPSDPVIYLYFLNAVMVIADIALYFRNRKMEGKAEV